MRRSETNVALKEQSRKPEDMVKLQHARLGRRWGTWAQGEIISQNIQ